MEKKKTMKHPETATEETLCTNRHALTAIMLMNGDTPEQLADLLGLTEKQLQRKMMTEFTVDEMHKIKSHYRLSAEQFDRIFFTKNELKSLQRKANAGLKRIKAGKQVYDMKAAELAACWENVRQGYDFEPLRLLYYSGLEAGYRMAMNEVKKKVQ